MRRTSRVVSPGTDSSVTVPPCAATIASTSDSPRPTPTSLPRVRAASPRANRSKACSTSSGGKPGPSSWTVNPSRRTPHRHRRAGRGVPGRVGQQVRGDLVQPQLVADHLVRRVHGVVGHVQAPPVVRRHHAGVRDRLQQQPGQVDRLPLQRPAGVEPGEQQQVLDQRGHPAGLLLDLVQCGAGRRQVVRALAGPARCSRRWSPAGCAARARRRRRTAAPAARCGAGRPARSRRGRAGCSVRRRPGRPRCARR